MNKDNREFYINGEVIVLRQNNGEDGIIECEIFMIQEFIYNDLNSAYPKFNIYNNCLLQGN